jgi:hypothetical protein
MAGMEKDREVELYGLLKIKCAVTGLAQDVGRVAIQPSTARATPADAQEGSFKMNTITYRLIRRESVYESFH